MAILLQLHFFDSLLAAEPRHLVVGWSTNFEAGALVGRFLRRNEISCADWFESAAHGQNTISHLSVCLFRCKLITSPSSVYPSICLSDMVILENGEIDIQRARGRAREREREIEIERER